MATEKPKTIRDENLKKFITILSDICKKYRAVNGPKFNVYGKAINSITTLGTTEFKKRMKNGTKIPYFGPKLTALYNEFIKTGKIDMKRIDERAKDSVKTKLTSLRKQVNQLNKDLKEKEQLGKPRSVSKISKEINTIKSDIKNLKNQLINMSEMNFERLDVSDNSMINFSELLFILSNQIKNKN